MVLMLENEGWTENNGSKIELNSVAAEHLPRSKLILSFRPRTVNKRTAFTSHTNVTTSLGLCFSRSRNMCGSRCSCVCCTSRCSCCATTCRPRRRGRSPCWSPTTGSTGYWASPWASAAATSARSPSSTLPRKYRWYARPPLMSAGRLLHCLFQLFFLLH